MHIILIGAGIGGLTTALVFAKQKVKVTLIERAACLPMAGTGLQLGPNACKILIGLGLEDAMRACGHNPESLEIGLASSSRSLFSMALGASAEDRWGAPYLQFQRSDLQNILLKAVVAEPHIDLHLGREPCEIDQTENEVILITQDGKRFEAEFLIGCDGLRSFTRFQLFDKRPERFTGQVAFRGMVEANKLPNSFIAPVAQVWTGMGMHFVHYYVGRDRRMINFVGLVKKPDFKVEKMPWGLAEARKIFKDWPLSVTTLLERVHDVVVWPLYDYPYLKTWHIDRVGLLGDACHPMLPYLAQGAGMAIEDAASLVKCFVEADKVNSALQLYENLRKPRVQRVQRVAQRNARIFHLPDPLARSAFSAMKTIYKITGRPPAAQFDWLYGYEV